MDRQPPRQLDARNRPQSLNQSGGLCDAIAPHTLGSTARIWLDRIFGR
jgi:hypothetical protein